MNGGTILLLVLLLLFGLNWWAEYKAHLNQLGPRERALAEASHGAAMIVLPVVAYVVGIGAILPPWSRLAALAVMFWGGLRLFNGAKFSVGWRDPQLIARALVKIGVGVAVYVLVWQATTAWVPRGLLAVIASYLYTTAPFGKWSVVAIVWWCLVTGTTKLILVLRGFPPPPWGEDPPGMPHGTAGFSNPNDPGWKL